MLVLVLLLVLVAASLEGTGVARREHAAPITITPIVTSAGRTPSR